MTEYEQMMKILRDRGWQQGDPMPVDLATARTQQAPPQGAGTMADPMQLSTMNVQGQPPQPAQAGQGGPAPSIYDNMSDEQLQQMAGMGDLDRQMELAESMRDQDPLKGRYVNQGRTYVGDSPIAHAVRGYGIYKGKKDAERIGGEQTQGRRTFIDLLRDRDRRRPVMEGVDPFQGGSGGAMNA